MTFIYRVKDHSFVTQTENRLTETVLAGLPDGLYEAIMGNMSILYQVKKCKVSMYRKPMIVRRYDLTT